MTNPYPNLELIEYKAKQLYTSNNSVLKWAADIKKPKYLEFDLIVFPQWWGSTCTGFDVMPDGSPAIGGCAMTKEYTTVVHELHTDTFIVFFGNSPCYSVDHATDVFFADLYARNMAGLCEAMRKY